MEHTNSATGREDKEVFLNEENYTSENTLIKIQRTL